MHRIALAALIIAITASTADARRRHHRYFVYQQAPVMMLAPGAAEAMRADAGGSTVRRSWCRATGS